MLLTRPIELLNPAISTGVVSVIKRCIARPRPYRNCPGIRACGRSLDEYSFPSGHTMHSVAFSLILYWADRVGAVCACAAPVDSNQAGTP